MKNLAAKSFEHLYRILKVYVVLGLTGALIGVLYSVLTTHSYVAAVILTIIAGFYTGKVLLGWTHGVTKKPARSDQ